MKTILPVLVGVSLALAGASVGAQAQVPEQKQIKLAIERQSLRDALNEWAQQTGFQLVSEITSELVAPSVKGTLTPQAALDRLLAGTPLTYEWLNDRVVAVRDKTQAISPAMWQSVGREMKQPRLHLVQLDESNRPEQIGQTNTAAAEPQNVTRKSQSADPIDEVVVTGSHIRGAQSASPMLSLDRSDFAAAGASTVPQMLRTLPQNFTGGPSEWAGAIASQRNGNGQNVGFGAGVNLRGLGSGSTLVLLNSRRLAPGGTGAFVDISTIPLSALQRIDVITDGASAIYGSDAVGGVVNFVLRDNYEGAETSVRYGGVTSGHLDEINANQLIGSEWQRGSALANVEYFERNSLLASDRDFANEFSGGTTYLIPRERRWGILLNGHQNLTESITLSGTGYYNHRKSAGRTFTPLFVKQDSSDVDVRQTGGTVALDWSLPASWNFALSETRSRNDTDRLNIFGDSIFGPGSQNRVSYLLNTSATEASVEGPVFQAAGGPVRLALGGEYRREELDTTQRFGSVPQIDRHVEAAYAELYVPLLGQENDIGWIHRLDLTAALRYERYDDFGSATNPKLGVVWSPVRGFNVRASYGKSFRAPTLNELDGSLATGLLFNAPNPGSPTGTTIIAILAQAPSPNLGPERATTWTAGLELMPELLGGLNIQATYFDIAYRDRINASFGLGTAFTDPLLSPRLSVPGNAEVMAAISALPPSRFINLTTFPLSAAQATLDGRSINLASTQVSGVDITVAKTISNALGQFGLGVNANYVFEFENQVIPTSQPISIVSTVFNPVDLRLRANVSWSQGPWTIATFVNYVDHYTDNQPTTPQRVPSWTTVDLSAAYRFEPNSGWARGMTLRVNAQNAFDRAPPSIVDMRFSYANPGFDTENANPLGRFISFQVSKSW